MSHELIVEESEFKELCVHIRNSGIVAFDTEFVSEDTYRAELCLLQLATHEQCIAVDPSRVDDLSAWWDIMTDQTTTVVTHAARQEVRFCLVSAGRRPRKLVDIQIAEGLRSRSYPLNYQRLMDRVLNKRIHGKETRTDWRRRPLSQRQIEYALEDVAYVLPAWERQRQSLQSLGRAEWAEAEFERMIDEIAEEGNNESWRRLSGIHKLDSRGLAVAREMYRWRDSKAAKRNQPPRRVLRDDLLLDLARRQPQTVSELLATRDMHRSNYRRSANEMVESIKAGLAVPDDELPRRSQKADTRHEESVLAKLLAVALTNRCGEFNVSANLVGSGSDLRDFIRWHLNTDSSKQPPLLAQGWRAEMCGDLLGDILDGKISFRVSDPESDHPLQLEYIET